MSGKAFFIFLKQSQSEKNLNKSVSAGEPVETTLCACVFDTDTPCTDVMHFTSSCPHLHLQTSGRDRFHLKHLMFFTFYLRKKKLKLREIPLPQKKKRYNNKVTLISRLQLLDQNNENYVFPQSSSAAVHYTEPHSCFTWHCCSSEHLKERIFSTVH